MRRLANLLVLVAAACADAGQDSGTLRYYLTADPVSLDPALSTDVQSGEMITMLFDTLVRFDHAASVAEVLHGDRDAVAAWLSGERSEPKPGAVTHGETTRHPEKDDYERSVRRAKQYIREGDAFQIVVSQRAERPTDVSALSLYRSLRRINPSPYHFLLDLAGIALVGSSPETLVKLEGTRASLNPIAGTTGPGEGEAEELLASGKDRAEHIMLVDLGRNDLSRVCKPGTVRVGKFL